MEPLRSPGIGSGLDINGLVNSLVSAEITPATQRLSTRQTRINVELSAIGSLRGALSGVNSALATLTTAMNASASKATVPSTERFSVSSGSGAVAGTYNVEVMALAQAGKSASAAYVGGASTELGAGSVEITFGADSFTVNLGAGSASSLTALRDAINEASDNPGVSASLLNEVGGTRLVLTGNRSGADAGLSVSSSLLSFSPVQTASDAYLRIDGFDVYSASNRVEGAIDGLTLDLAKAAPGTVDVVTVARDDKPLTDAANAFVNAYNNAINTMRTLTQYDAAKQTAAALTGDPTVRSAQQQLRALVGNPQDTGGAFTLLSELGFKTGVDGTISLNSTEFSAALAQDRGAVQALISGEQGVGTRMKTLLDGLVGADGLMDARSDGLNRQTRDVEQQQAALSRRSEQLEARYRLQFNGLDQLLAQMNSTSNYLTQQLAGLSQLR